MSIRLRSSVRPIEQSGARVAAASLGDGGSARANWFIIALPFEETAQLLPGDYSAFAHSPIVGIHLWFDRPVMKEPFAALLGGTMQWAFACEKRIYQQVSAHPEPFSGQRVIRISDLAGATRRIRGHYATFGE